MIFPTTFLLIIFVELCLNAVHVLSLRPYFNGNGVCTQSFSYTASHYVPYLETYKEKAWGIFYETKVRVNYRIEYSTQYRTEEVCCDGYKEIIVDYCIPVCVPPCQHGSCEAPNNCTCFPGYEEVLHSEDFVCHPVCKEDCGHGKCVKPNTCSCEVGYSTKADGLTCQPHCDQDCEMLNASCVQPATCACKSGYKRVDNPSSDRICEPHCEMGCHNADCTEPNVCTCHDGYVPTWFNGLCEPRCDKGCRFGHCVAPNVCECFEGSVLTRDNTCEPVCSQGCVMGKCVAPETCSCDEGYGFLNGSNHICYPICEKNCAHGTCTAPGVCTCHEGFQTIPDEFGEPRCKPYCEEQCEPYGECTAPHTCTCFEGYHLVQTDDLPSDFFADKSICKPICPEGCFNGFCSSPYVCSCLTGYEPSNHNKSNICSPICEVPCGLGSTCTAPNHCTCKDGYREHNCSSSTCEQACEPICEIPCGLGSTCSAPNACTCEEGYRAHREHNCSFSRCEETCEPICEIPCGLGSTCTAPNNCTCNEGYRSVLDNGTRCEPVCVKDCGGGICTGPNNCTCHDGYDTDETGTCVPVCDPPCIFGTCTHPDVCLCSDNETNEESSCAELSCQKNCINGDCVAGQCVCPTGFVVNTNGSVTECTKCSKDCLLHGSCVDDEGTCECDFGFEGKNCEEITYCSFFIYEPNVTFPNVLDEVNQSIFNVYIYSPYCFECEDAMDNDTLCFNNDKDPDENYRMIRCIVSMNSPCYVPYEYNPLKIVVKVTGIVGGTAILIMCVAFAAAYVSLRKSRKRDVCRGRAQETNRQERIGTESLLAEETIQL